MSWIQEAVSPLTLEAEQQLAMLEISALQSFVVSPGTFADILAKTGLERLVVETLASLDPDDPDGLMLATFSFRAELLKTDLPDAWQDDLAYAYQRLSKQADLPEALVTVRPRGTSSHEGGRYRGLTALTRALLTLYAEHLTRSVISGGLFTLDEILQQTPELVVMQAMGWDCSGLLTSYEPKTGNRDFVVLMATWGLAEDIARKDLARDEYTLHKPTIRDGFSSLVRKRPGHKEFRLDFDIDAGRMRHGEVPHERVRELTLKDDEAMRLARAALILEEALGHPIELDWGMEVGWSRQLHLLSFRPGTPLQPRPLRVYQLLSHGDTLVTGKAAGTGLVTGLVRVVEGRDDLDRLRPGEILVARKTEPDWEPAFRQAAAIVTELDTRVSHATILARELGIPALLEASGSSLFLETGQQVTVSCCHGEVGHVFEGPAEFSSEEFDAAHLPQLKTELMISLSMPERALVEAQRPWAGAGLIRSEFMLSGWVRIHPLALLRPERLSPEVQGTVNRLCRGYSSKRDYFLDQMSQGIATIASAFWPRPVILRLSDLKTHEYAKLVGGDRFEPEESNPVLGFRGAARYLHEDYQDAFRLELDAIRRVRQGMGLRNLHLMVPFCRTPQEGEQVLELLAEAGLPQGGDGLQVWVMAELPSNVILADQFAELFDGMSIGSNDLTQLTLGVDRDNKRISSLFDEIDPVLMACYQRLIEAARESGKKIGFCGQIASEDPLFAATLAEMGIDSVSVAPDAFTATMQCLR